MVRAAPLSWTVDCPNACPLMAASPPTMPSAPTMPVSMASPDCNERKCRLRRPFGGAETTAWVEMARRIASAVGTLGLTYPAPMSFNNPWHYCPVPTALPPCKLELWLRKTRFLIGVSRDGSAGGCYQEVISEGKIIAERSGGSSHLTPRRSSHTRILGTRRRRAPVGAPSTR